MHRSEYLQVWDDFEKEKIDPYPYALGMALLARCEHGHVYPPNIETVKRCIQKGADLSLFDERGRTALHLAATWGHVAVVLHLLQAGMDPDQQSECGYTLLHYLVNSVSGVQILSQVVQIYHVNMEIVDDCGFTVLYHAVRHRRSKVPLLLSLGARFHLEQYLCSCGKCCFRRYEYCFIYRVHIRWVLLMGFRKKLPKEMIRMVVDFISKG
jgi:hypothetical protein